MTAGAPGARGSGWSWKPHGRRLPSALASFPATTVSLAATSIGVAGAVLGVCCLRAAARPGGMVSLSGGLLMGIAAFGILPELAGSHGWAGGLGILLLGVALLWLVGRYVYPVCPACSHSHEHELCATSLHGFAMPMALAASVHSFLDGLGIAAAYRESVEGLGTAVLAAVMLHKVPEGLALGVMLRAALPSRAAALAVCVAAEGATFLAALLEALVGPRWGGGWAEYALALAGGSFLYLGFHAAHGDWKRRGSPALPWVGVGVAGAAALQQGLHLLLH